MLGASCSTARSAKPKGRAWSNEEWCQQREPEANGKEMYICNKVFTKSYLRFMTVVIIGWIGMYETHWCNTSSVKVLNGDINI